MRAQDGRCCRFEGTAGTFLWRGRRRNEWIAQVTDKGKLGDEGISEEYRGEKGHRPSECVERESLRVSDTQHSLGGNRWDG